MARLTFPTRQQLEQPHGQQGWQQIDPYAAAECVGDALSVTLSDTESGTQLDLRHVPGRWDLLPTISHAADNEPVVIPEPLLTRANRLMQSEGVSLQRDWRTKTHVLRAGPRRVLPLEWGVTAAAVNTARGWVAAPGSTAPAPVAPLAPDLTPDTDPDQPAPGAGQPAPSVTAPSRGATMPVSGIPAAYAGSIILDRATRQKWHAVRAAHRAGVPMVIGMVGPSGAGKTHAVHALSAEEGLDVVKFDASGVIEPGDWFGTVVLDGSGTRFVPSDLLVALTLPGARTLLIDEANRANMRALNALLPVLDGSGTVTIPQSGKRERINPAVQIVVTANIGSMFLATEPLDEAIRTRVSTWIEVSHLGETEEAALLMERIAGIARTGRERAVKAESFTYDPARLTAFHAANLAGLGAALRSTAESNALPPVSTRQLLAAGHLIAAGLDPRLAVDAAIVDGYSAEGGASSERTKVRVPVTGIQWTQPEPGQVMTGEEVCKCGHGPGLHGIGTDISVSTHCRSCVRDYPGNAARQCAAYAPVMVAAEQAEPDYSF